MILYVSVKNIKCYRGNYLILLMQIIKTTLRCSVSCLLWIATGCPSHWSAPCTPGETCSGGSKRNWRRPRLKARRPGTARFADRSSDVRTPLSLTGTPHTLRH
ncbi:hypothetical protein CEXT_570551 [Caerostris extrusa]|uniref:Uncharacterized protein n=1 Tax=Caerostris extrusa TaxID=172846 RepID=A0AAV4SXK1_CAEEX|nr:hypothetical protein CEXT_570551 [Caerostris extrusa]